MFDICWSYIGDCGSDFRWEVLLHVVSNRLAWELWSAFHVGVGCPFLFHLMCKDLEGKLNTNLPWQTYIL